MSRLHTAISVLAAAFVLSGVAAAAERTLETPVAPEGQPLVALVTGSTSGLGREVALRLGDAGAHVIVHGRDRRAARKWRGKSNGAAAARASIRADFIDLDNVRELAGTVLAQYPRLDLLHQQRRHRRTAGTPRERTTATS
jgi:uncharacterized protein YbjT (DUF2867 family)